MLPDPSIEPRVGALGRLAGWAFRRRGRASLAWVAAFAAATGLAASFAGDFAADYSAPGSDSRQAQDLLADASPPGRRHVDVVVQAEGGRHHAGRACRCRRLLAEFATVPHVPACRGPYPPGAISADGRHAARHSRST